MLGTRGKQRTESLNPSATGNRATYIAPSLSGIDYLMTERVGCLLVTKNSDQG
jgi:hypothetical protein